MKCNEENYVERLQKKKEDALNYITEFIEAKKYLIKIKTI